MQPAAAAGQGAIGSRRIATSAHTVSHPSVSESLELQPAAAAQRLLRVDRVPSVSFGIPRIATCRGCPEGFEWTGCHPSVSEPLEMQPAAAAQRVFLPLLKGILEFFFGIYFCLFFVLNENYFFRL